MTSLLPSHPGLLPYWHLLTAAISVYNTFQSYYWGKASKLTRLKGPAARAECSDLNARTFGVWKLLAAVVRVYGAYRIDNEDIYVLTLATYGLALWYFALEWLVYGTAKAGRGLWPVVGFSSCSLVWMVLTREYYLHQ